MKVAMVGPHPLPGEAAVGGVEAVMETLVRALRDAGVTVTVVTCALGARQHTRIERDGIRYVVIPTHRTRGRLTWFVSERRAIRRAIRAADADVAHVQGANFYGPPTLAAGLPTVVTLHGIYYREAHITDTSSGLGERMSKRLRGAGNTHFERVTLRNATDLVIISPYVEDAVRGRTAARLHHIPNPIAPDFYGIQRHPVPGRVLFVGSIEPRKNVLTLVNAFHSTRERAPDARLRVVGRPMDAEYHAAVVSAIESSGDDRITYLGVVPNDRLLEEYATASMLVLPSREESSPIAIQQAMAVGVPVVASRAGGIDRLVRHGSTGLLVSPGDERELADAIVSLATSADIDVMGAAARSGAGRFRDEAVASATLEVYEELLRRTRATAAS
jgi:glycosyltransferase involved in cell wall biosynthesis